MRLFAAALLLALSACAGRVPAPVPQQATPPLPYPPAAAERVVRLALAEWRDWGGTVREAWSEAPGGAPESLPPESTIGNFPRVLAYWRAVEDDEGAIRDNRQVYAAAVWGLGSSTLWSNPAWSAAFISWTYRGAGVDAREFPPNATHSLYLDALIADARAFPATAPFLPHAPGEYAPRPADLVCFDRSSRNRLSHWTERLAEAGVPRPMHCDIVTAVAPGVVEVVGGNVGDTVTLTRYPTDAAGRILPAPPGKLPLLVVMESRLGRLPPFAP
ncbi:DUF2272 domain-containing protein [Falsiroseomonas tokyonensis]|uniref:DUF2272 domain-containing protein n=1 Tax=Falsiroseomonas tokyonensis TaxID=430521 RepID=A0ABV7BSF2_9PROT|nr:DUF2272 domain-containing protein [Falsiroseomonas tokyonensis]MBU8537042.1 DUF2272 domain-containing protein [Falsiroseomonas tokyonensis]